MSRLVSRATAFRGKAQRAVIAQARVASASATSTGVKAAREAARISSYTDPTNVLTGTDAGADATIAIANHTRVYPVQGDLDVPDVAIAAVAAVTGLAYATDYFAFYDDATMAETAPTVQVTLDPAIAQVGYAAGRHFLGKVTTPAAAAPPTSGGGGSGPPGGGGGWGGVLP